VHPEPEINTPSHHWKLDRADSGTIEMNGVNVRKLSDKRWLIPEQTYWIRFSVSSFIT